MLWSYLIEDPFFSRLGQMFSPHRLKIKLKTFYFKTELLLQHEFNLILKIGGRREKKAGQIQAIFIFLTLLLKPGILSFTHSLIRSLAAAQMVLIHQRLNYNSYNWCACKYPNITGCFHSIYIVYIALQFTYFFHYDSIYSFALSLHFSFQYFLLFN